MDRRIAVFSAAVLLASAIGCNSEPSHPAPAVIVEPAPSVSDEARKHDQELRKKIEEERRKHPSGYVQKSDTYKKYIP